MKVRLVCIDVDGTLVGSKAEVPAEVWAAADRARARGIHLAICSGRPAFGTSRKYAAQLDPGGWHVFQNGASIVHLPTGQSRSAPLEPWIVAMLVERARRSRRLLELYTDDAYAYELPTEIARAHARVLGVPFEPRPFESLEGPIVRAQWVLPDEDVEATLSDPHPGLEIARSFSPVIPSTTFVNLTRSKISKASAVLEVAAALGVALSDVMMIGDAQNDLQAMKEVGWPVAVENAEPEVRAVAKHVVRDVEHAGVAEALDLACRSWDLFGAET